MDKILLLFLIQLLFLEQKVVVKDIESELEDQGGLVVVQEGMVVVIVVF